VRLSISGHLEIDQERGVIYFHAMDPDQTEYLGSILRICSLPVPIPDPLDGKNLDITHLVGCNWRDDAKLDDIAKNPDSRD
jgi:hypothetical protein